MNPMVSVNIFDLYRVTWKLKVIQSSIERSVLCLTFTLKVTEWHNCMYSWNFELLDPNNMDIDTKITCLAHYKYLINNNNNANFLLFIN